MLISIRRISSGLVVVSYLLCMSGCDDDYDLPASDTRQTAPTAKQETVPTWLQPYHQIDPAAWLIVRSHAALNGEVTSRQQRIDLLGQASTHFRESQRMIANRAAQLEDMLLEKNIHNSAVSLIDDFNQLPTIGTPHNFSSYCQYYFNLRSQGHNHEEALQALAVLK